MKIAIVCYASVGGSGIVATELAKCLAARGHQLHVLSREQPFRLGEDQPGVVFHRVVTPSYPLFREPQYVLSLATRIAQISRAVDLDIIHAHYAIPHATAAYLARQILESSGGPTPKVVTTLHGTDITIVGSDPSYAETIGFSIERSDGVTAVSESLKADTYRGLPVTRDIRVIPNFLDCRIHHRVPAAGLRERYAGPDRAVVIHVSNFRPVKRIPALIDVFARIRASVPSVLLLVGDGPDLPQALALARERGIDADVLALGEQEDVRQFLSIADLFLLPSATESFGLVALEAMACDVPVIASRVGGLPEVIEHGVSGFLHAPDDLAGMAASGIAILTDTGLRERLAAAGRRLVHDRFCADRIVPVYEKFYEEVLGRGPAVSARQG
ncbi:MAG: N-acetyl-alpha-D-glucosaminyl L-malate synthase BshA [Acidobacteria bacterium]|nr:MAG: N-acetyl-alpha-D-glucosaminyl L-malate synthase BshA [Acidobacteriota bacterium]